ncbi:MAG TPA: bifunctional serine/threonine-protein kinase/formylglycine-generating enzyme family protein [Sandaracinaceae bacterium LLY-WYZ-13_1]|nr:bifunctional serine/threonine-protein kinase/formylglycine-generating enzyme family protein [Sandaracinaceae bacterium LLY-WYZ-13_1]
MDDHIRRWGRARGLSEEDLRTLARLVVRAAARAPETERALAPGPGGNATPARYRDLGRLARGGSAEIRRVVDRVMARDVAMKILSWEHADSPVRRARFLDEARITARLEHPGVVPVHDRGELPDGRPYFTMKIVRGEPWSAVVRRHDAPHDPVARRKRVGEVLRMCETMAHAHTRGVVHRDLKPANVMVGAVGELLVMDWGIARDREGDASTDEAVVGHDPCGDASATRTGDIFGTVAYMAPEQARGAVRQISPATDVWALGLLLFEALTGRRAFDGTATAVWGRIVAGARPELPSDIRVPGELEAILQRATQVDPAARYPDASAMTDDLRAWIDGEAARDRARATYERARELGPALERIRARRREHLERASRLRQDIRGSEPEAVKRPLWAVEDEAERLGQRGLLLEEERLELLRAALQHDPDHEAARREIARHYRAKLEEAEAAQRSAEAARWELLLRRHDDGAHADFLAGRGSLTLETDRPARVSARRYRVVDRRLRLDEATDLGPTPLRRVPLDAGSYRLDIRAPGGPPVRYPVRIEREKHWDGVAPGGEAPVPVHLPRAGTLGPDEVYVPAGWTTLGGDELAAESLPRQRLWVDGFVLRRFPVTNEEYLRFLDDLAARGRGEDALRWAPRRARGSAAEDEEALAVVRRPDGRFVLGSDAHERPLEARWPVAGVTWHAARAYAAWYAGRTGQPWRLPVDLEWEKAARGVDERVYPWGAEPEQTWARILGCDDETPSRAGIDSHPVDESPYGVRGLAGNVRDWCANAWTLEGPAAGAERLVVPRAEPGDDELRVIKGGAWQTVPAFARAAGRFASEPGGHFAVVGFRLCRSLPHGA